MPWSPTTLRMALAALSLACLLALKGQEAPQEDAPFSVQFMKDAPELLIPRDERLTFLVKVGVGVLGASVGTVNMESSVKPTSQGIVLLAPGGQAPTGGERAEMLITAKGDYQFYSLDAMIKTTIHPQSWPWIVYRFEQSGSKVAKRELILGTQGEKPHARLKRDTSTNAPKGTRIWKAPKERDLPVLAIDLLSSVYYARNMVREDLAQMSFPVADKLDLWELRLRRGKEGVLETDAGSFDGVQILLQPRLYPGEESEKAKARAAEFEGLFGLKGSIELWVERSTGVPLLITGEIPVGLGIALDVEVVLQSYSGTPPEFRPVS